jgi:hypothetical protein
MLLRRTSRGRSHRSLSASWKVSSGRRAPRIRHCSQRAVPHRQLARWPAPRLGRRAAGFHRPSAASRRPSGALRRGPANRPLTSGHDPRTPSAGRRLGAAGSLLDGSRPLQGGDHPPPGGNRPRPGGSRPFLGGDRPFLGGSGPFPPGGGPLTGNSGRGAMKTHPLLVFGPPVQVARRQGRSLSALTSRRACAGAPGRG